jgi:hypothetical protein
VTAITVTTNRTPPRTSASAAISDETRDRWAGAKGEERHVVGVHGITAGERLHDLAGAHGTLESLDLDVHHVVGEPAAVREALPVTTEDAESILLLGVAPHPDHRVGLGITAQRELGNHCRGHAATRRERGYDESRGAPMGAPRLSS